MTEWVVRRVNAKRQTGFGSAGEIATATFARLVENAKDSGETETFELEKDGEVVSRAIVPARKGAD
jgi:hypothetical protein